MMKNKNNNMKYLFTLSLILFSVFSHSEDINYYCVGQNPYSYYSDTDSMGLKSGSFSNPKSKGVLTVNYEKKFITSKFLGFSSYRCDEIQNNILHCFDSLQKTLSFNPKVNKYFFVLINSGQLGSDWGYFIRSEIGQCEKVD